MYLCSSLSDVLSEVFPEARMTGDQMKCTVTISKIKDFSGFEKWFGKCKYTNQ